MTRVGGLSSVALLLFFGAVPAGAQTFRTGAEPVSAPGAFGNALAVVDGQVLVGEPENQLRPGIVYVYTKASGAWAETAQITASDGVDGDGFGSAIAVDGAMMIVGATEQDDERGAAYVFTKRADGSWQETARLTAANGAQGDGFGAAVAISGDWAMVGAPGHGEAGAVYTFRRDPTGWTQQGGLVPASVSPRAIFGAALAMDAGRALIGAPGQDDRTGVVYAFRLDPAGGVWIETGTVVATGIQQNHAFGAAIAIDGDDALIGAPLFAGGTGAVFTFRVNDAGEWQERNRLAAFVGSGRDAFGASLAFNGGEAWIGSPAAERRRGAAFVYRRDDTAGWVAATRVDAEPVARGDRFGSAVAVRGDVAAVSLAGDDYGAGSVIIFERDDAGEWREAGFVLSEIESLAAVTGGTVRCGDGQAAHFDCDQVDLVAFLPVQDIGGERGVELNDIWGWTDPETGREYALVGRVDGTSFVDITDPINPVYLGNLPKTAASPGSTWRDIKVYENHAFIVADGAGPHGMQVFDLTQLRDVRNAPVTFEVTAHYDRIASAHNIVINKETGFAYAVGSSSGGETCGGGLHMINIQDPDQPEFAGCFSDPRTGRASTGYTHDAQCVLYEGPDEEYRGREICFGANETALSIADVTDKDNPVALARAGYPNVGYSHQGWLTEDQRYFYMDDELDELAGSVTRTRTIIWDIAELEDPQVVGQFLGTTGASDHNLYILDDLMYQSNYQAGLRVIDISDPLNPVEVGYFDTVPYGTNTAGFGGSWSNYPFFESGVIVVTSGNEGLFLVRVHDELTS